MTGTLAAAHGKMKRRQETGKGKKAHALGIRGMGMCSRPNFYSAASRHLVYDPNDGRFMSIVVLVVSGFILASHEIKNNSKDVPVSGNVHNTREYTDKIYTCCSTREEPGQKEVKLNNDTVVEFAMDKNTQ